MDWSAGNDTFIGGVRSHDGSSNGRVNLQELNDKRANDLTLEPAQPIVWDLNQDSFNLETPYGTTFYKNIQEIKGTLGSETIIVIQIINGLLLEVVKILYWWGF